jgi:putative transposase
MKLFKSHDPNTFHYTTSVCYQRVPIFRAEKACELFIEALAAARIRCPFKLIGYVIMPDHTHLILNPLDRNISVTMGRVKSLSARDIIDWLTESRYTVSRKKLELAIPQKRRHSHAVWQKDFSSIDLWSPKFIRQKLNYIHLNPVRAGFCKHPAEWRWSSYRAYLPHEPGSVPLEMDLKGYWSEEELIGA